jgi:ATP-dependent Clp protease adapter protein ClpS
MATRSRKYELFLFNDDVNTMEHIVESLHDNIPLCNRLRAEQMATTAEAVGMCRIYSGLEVDVFFMYSTLRKCGLYVDALVKPR